MNPKNPEFIFRAYTGRRTCTFKTWGLQVLVQSPWIKRHALGMWQLLWFVIISTIMGKRSALYVEVRFSQLNRTENHTLVWSSCQNIQCFQDFQHFCEHFHFHQINISFIDLLEVFSFTWRAWFSCGLCYCIRKLSTLTALCCFPWALYFCFVYWPHCVAAREHCTDVFHLI